MANKPQQQSRQAAQEANPLHQQAQAAAAATEADAQAAAEQKKTDETSTAIQAADAAMGVSQLEDKPAELTVGSIGIASLAQPVGAITSAEGVSTGDEAAAGDTSASGGPEVIPEGKTATTSQDPLALPVAANAAPSKVIPGSTRLAIAQPTPVTRAVRNETPVVKVAEPAPTGSTLAFTEAITKVLETGTASAKQLVRTFEVYVTTMAPGRTISDHDLVRMQEGLLSQLTYVIEQAPSAEFKSLWNIAIAFFAEYSTKALSPKYFNRGGSVWRTDQELYHRLTALLNLLYHSAINMKTVRSEVSLEKTLARGFSPEGRGRITTFYDL